jgi:DNA-3-methyladenine glycosylase
MNILTQKFYERDTLEVSQELLGKILIHEVNGKFIAGKIVETEGYVGVLDKAAHVYGNKRTSRVMPMYGPGGTVYIFNIYGMYLCLNAITKEEGEPQGVLIRALEPLIGLNFIANQRYKKTYSELTRKEKLNLTSGPSKLCIALDITKELNNTTFIGGEMYIVEPDEELKNLFEMPEEECGEIIKSKRIGIDYAEEAKDFLYRYYFRDNPYVSKKDKLVNKGVK